MSLFDDEARILLSREFDSGILPDIGASTSIFNMLADIYPVSGSKIAWLKVHGSIHQDNSSGQKGIEQFAALSLTGI